MIALAVIAAVAGFCMILGLVWGLCAAASEGRAEHEEVLLVAEVERLERVYALPTRDPERAR